MDDFFTVHKKENSGLLLALKHSIKPQNNLNLRSLKFLTLQNKNTCKTFKQVLQRVLKGEKDFYDTDFNINTNNFEFGN